MENSRMAQDKHRWSARDWIRRPFLWLAVCLLLASLAAIYPIYVIRPFRHQGPGELTAALFVLRYRSFLEITLVVAACIILILTWRHIGDTRRKLAASACALLVVASGVLSRINIYELMFHPVQTPTFSPLSKAKLDGDEEVIAIRVKGIARAYPIRSMSYHHIVNDVVGGLPIVATY